MGLLTSRARAYVYSGDWVADCPRECGNVEYLYHRAHPGAPWGEQKSTFFCSYCRMVAEIEWPGDMDGIMAVLSARPIPHTRNWYPHGHATAVRFSVPHGQSVQDLLDENRENGVL